MQLGLLVIVWAVRTWCMSRHELHLLLVSRRLCTHGCWHCDIRISYIVSASVSASWHLGIN